jgi:MFS family permease
MVLGLVVGLGADKWGLRRSLLTGLMLMALSSMVGAAATGFAWLLALRALEGLGFLLVAMPAPGLIRRSVKPSELGARMGWWGSYMPIGSAMGLLLGPWVLQATSWQTWWLALGCTSALAAYAVWRMVPADAAATAAVAATADEDGVRVWRSHCAAPAPGWCHWALWCIRVSGWALSAFCPRFIRKQDSVPSWQAC